jgi:hypothetical protein
MVLPYDLKEGTHRPSEKELRESMRRVGRMPGRHIPC